MRYQGNIIRSVVFAAVMIFATSCAMTPRGTVDKSGIEEIQKELATISKNNVKPVLPPAQITDALFPPLLPGTKRENDAKERFDIAVKDITANNFFMGLVAETSYNMVVHPKVEGLISLELNDVTVTDVMDIVRDVYGYPYKRRGNLFQVYPGGLRSEIFQIDYLSLKRQGVSETQITSGQVTNAGSSSSGNRGNNANNNSSNSNNNRGGSNGSQGTVGAQIRTETDSDFWKELKEALTVLVGEDEGRSIVVTPQAGIIVVRAMPEEIETAREFLKKAELIMRRQVVLEAKILEVQLNDGYQSGIDWSAVANANGNALNFGVTGSSTISPNAIGGAFSGVLKADDFFGVIELLST